MIVRLYFLVMENGIKHQKEEQKELSVADKIFEREKQMNKLAIEPMQPV